MSKLEYYLERIKYHSKQSGTFMNQKKYSAEVRNNVISLIDQNLDYILTESLMNYITRDGVSSIRLYKLQGDICQRIGALSSYYKNICDEYSNKNEKSYSKYIKLLDSETKEATIKAYNRIKYVYFNYSNYLYRLYDIEHIIYILLAYCHINKKLSDFDELCNVFIKDPYDTLEDLYINDIRNPMGATLFDREEPLIERVISKLESREKKKIM